MQWWCALCCKLHQNSAKSLCEPDEFFRHKSVTPHSYTTSVTQKYSASKRKYTTTTTNNTLMSCQNYQKCAKKLGALVEYWGRNVKILQHILRLAQNINSRKLTKMLWSVIKWMGNTAHINTQIWPFISANPIQKAWGMGVLVHGQRCIASSSMQRD